MTATEVTIQTADNLLEALGDESQDLGGPQNIVAMIDGCLPHLRAIHQKGIMRRITGLQMIRNQHAAPA